MFLFLALVLSLFQSGRSETGNRKSFAGLVLALATAEPDARTDGDTVTGIGDKSNANKKLLLHLLRQ